MTSDDSEVPPALQHAIEAAEHDSDGTAMDLHPPTDWHEYPTCGQQLYGQAVIYDEDELRAVKYTCDCLARWIWDAESDDLYYRGEAELSSASEFHRDE